MYGAVGVERADLRLGRSSPFESLARAAGMSVRDCQIAAAAEGGRLAAIIRIAQQRRTPREEEARRVRARLLEVRRRMADLEARR